MEIVIGKYDGEPDVGVDGEHEPCRDFVYFSEFGNVFGSFVNVIETLTHGVGLIEEFVASHGVVIWVQIVGTIHAEHVADGLPVSKVVVVCHSEIRII